MRGKGGSQYFFNAREKPSAATFQVTACEGMGEEWRWSTGEEEEGRGMRRKGGEGMRRRNSTIDGRGEATVEEMQTKTFCSNFSGALPYLLAR